MSRKEAVFCDLCQKHIESEEFGKSFFHQTASKKSMQRVFSHTAEHDISMCNSCIDDVLESLKESK